MEFYSDRKKNEIFSFASKWMELENIILSKVSQAKNRMFSPHKCSNIIGHGSHTKRRTCMGGIGEGKET
jgi:hypothetical protein